MQTQAQIEREIEMYAEGAELDLAMAKHFAMLARGAETREDAVAYSQAYNRCMRSKRQELAFLARLRKQEREHARAEARAAAAPEPVSESAPETTSEPPAAEAAAERQEALRSAVRRVIRCRLEWEALDEDVPDDAEARRLYARLDKRLAAEAKKPGFGAEPLDDHVIRVGTGLGLDPGGLANWRNLPDRDATPTHPPPAPRGALDPDSS
jgi:hypothetical protein